MPLPLATEAARPSVGDLTVAFRTLDRSSRRLEEAYRRLVERVQAIDRELVETNERLARKVEELDSLTRLLNDILGAMHSGVVAVDVEGRVTSFNQAAERVLGVRADAVLGQPHEAAFRNGDGSASPLAMTLSTGQAIGGVEREVATRGGARLCLSSRVAPIRSAQGRVVGAVEIFSDLTEFRELQERLDRADKLAALGQMTAQVAHEVRNPLNSIEGFADLLVRDLGPDDRRRDFAAHIATSARSLNKIVTNMLDFSQPFAVQARPVALRELVEEALAFALEEARHLGGGEPDVQLDVDPDADAVEADPDLIRQALLNLLSNAVQAMPDGGALRVRVEGRGSGVEEPQAADAGGGTAEMPGQEREPAASCGREAHPPRPSTPDPRPSDLVAIRIQDSGPGIPEAIRDRVLDPFFTTRTQGTGLGLAIVQKIARRHGGHLALDSAPGEGTTAVLTLPRRAAAPCDEAPQGQAARDPQPQTPAR